MLNPFKVFRGIERLDSDALGGLPDKAFGIGALQLLFRLPGPVVAGLLGGIAHRTRASSLDSIDYIAGAKKR